MSTEVKTEVVEAAVKEPTSGAGVEVAASEKEEMVSKKELEAAVKESIKRKDELATLKKEREALAKQIEEIKTKDMKAQGMWKEIAETNEKKAGEYENKYNSLQKALVDNTKYNAFKDAVTKLGLQSKAIKYLDDSSWLDMVEVETTSTGRVNVLNADKVASTFKSENPFLFQDLKAPNINTTTPGVVGSSGPLTPAAVYELGKKYSKTKSDVDKAAYEKALIQLKNATN